MKAYIWIFIILSFVCKFECRGEK